MEFRKSDIKQAHTALLNVLGEISSPYNDGWTASACKLELYVLKCWLEDEYCKLSTFVGEEQWEQEQILEILKQ